MSFSLKNPKGATMRIFAGICVVLGLGFLAEFAAQGRSIEFSEPEGSLTATNLNSLAPNPSIVDPYNVGQKSLLGTQKLPGNSMRPLPPPRVVRSGSSANRNGSTAKSWAIMTPDEMMQSLVERDVFKMPRSDSGENGSDSSYQIFRHNSVTNRFDSSDSLRGGSDTNRFGSESDFLRSYDPFGSQERRNLQGNSRNSSVFGDKPDSTWDFFKRTDDNSPEAIKERKAQVDRVDAFKKMLDTTASVSTPKSAIPQPSFGFGTPAMNSSLFNPGSPSSVPVLAAPTAPTAPTAPLAPGQSPVVTYTPLPKPKATGFEIQKRRF
jgi:hypothetical protein